jgi:hypothetical protein
MHGTLEARNLDGGCIFTIELPRVTVGSS